MLFVHASIFCGNKNLTTEQIQYFLTKEDKQSFKVNGPVYSHVDPSE